MTEEKLIPDFKLFNKYDLGEVQITDEGLKSAINLEPKIILKDQGRNVQKYGKLKVNIVERLINRISNAGHRGKKHRIEKGKFSGKYSKAMKIILDSFEIIEKRTKQNPIQVLVKAIENSSPRDEVTVIEYGGARYPQAVDISPLRRISLALRWITQGASDKAFGKKKKLSQALAEEIILASENNGESFGCRKRNESEKQADSAR